MDDNLYDKLRELTGKIPEKFSILEEQIDVKLQMEYFKFSSRIKKSIPKDTPIVLEEIPDLYDEKISIEVIKESLVKLASIDDPKAYRLIEAYLKDGKPELNHWTILAQQESKMLLESTLLNENQVFISTGLGGKGNMLRYFIVFIGEEISEFNDFQQNILKSEFEFALKSNQSELEEITFNEHFATMVVLIPFDVPFQKIFREAIAECNNYGNFLKPNFLVTNVKKLSTKEISEFLENNELPDSDSMDNLGIEPNDDEA